MRHRLPSGVTLYETIRHANPQSKDLIPPPCQWGYLFNVYDEIATHGKDYGMGGASPLKWTEIEAWWRVFGVAYSREELGVIMKIDRLMMTLEANRHDDGRTT